MNTAVDERPASDIPAEESLPGIEFENRPVHLARCGDPECAIAVKFKPSLSGASFILVDADPDASFGVGENGRPVCPNGHGEMTIADDALKPAAEAFAEAQSQLDAANGPVQRTLPGCVPIFNFQGCYLELERQAVLVEALRKEYEDDARVAKESKKAWDEAEEKYTKMGLEFRRRRQSKEDGTDEGARPAKATVCAWEAKRTDGERCGLCSGEASPFVVRSILGDPSQLAAADAQAHVADVDRFLLGLEVQEVGEALENVDTYITADVIATWTSEDRKAVTRYADALLDQANNVPDTVVPERPAVLGKPHIPAKAADDEHQVCSLCEVVIHPASDTEHTHYDVRAYVGVDCVGKVKDGHRYPTGKKKPAAAKAPKPKAAKKK